MTAARAPRRIDPRVPRFSQAMTGILLLVVFLIQDLWNPAIWAVPLLAVILGLGAILGPKANLWGLLFRHVVRPIARLGPPVKLKDPAPTRFAMLLGTVFLAVATILLLTASTTTQWIGWALVLMVAALALLAAITNLCVGCEIYNLMLRQRDRKAQRGAR
jgi:hypothetical protein